MKTKYVLILNILLILIFDIFAQPKIELLFQKRYEDFPLKLRLENCGIYFISSFDIAGNTMYFKSFDENKLILFSQNNKIDFVQTEFKGGDFYIDENNSCRMNNLSEYGRISKVFLNNEKLYFSEFEGKYINSSQNEINLIKKNESELDIFTQLKGIEKKHSLKFEADFGCAEFIGMDRDGNLFLLIEKIIKNVPLKVSRYIYVLDKEGKILSIQQLIPQKFFYTIRDLTIDEEGNLYQLISDEEKFSIVKYAGLNRLNTGVLKIPEKYAEEIHYNNFTKTDEIQTIPNNMNITASSRSVALRLGEMYVYQRYYCNPVNLAPAGVTAPDGDIVQTPSWLVVGWNSRIPYKWGGFDDLNQFISGLAIGRYAGDINTNGVSSYAKGVDCSGFVSRCWQLSYHASTSYMPNITTKYSSWLQLKPGDGIHKVGHVRLFVKFNQNGTLKTVESAGRNWDVSYWSFSLSDLSSYSPVYYNGMSADFSDKWITLLSARNLSDNKVELKWSDDTTNVIGYKIYDSEDGINWAVRATFNKSDVSKCEITRVGNRNFYRVASVLNSLSGNAESFYSNSLSATNTNLNSKVLIIDGFNREGGSWQGAGHNFVINYAKSLKKLNLTIESCKNSEIQNETINLNNYFAVYWFVGDESTANETLDSTEQRLIRNYLESGGNLFISGSEIGYDLYQYGTAYDREFFTNYLKAAFVADNANDRRVKNSTGGIFDTISFFIGQVYYEDSPDVINPINGSNVCLKYFNNLNAGICYSGKFGNSNNIGKIIFLSFALETTADETGFDFIISKSFSFFNTPLSIDEAIKNDKNFYLLQNYPNPFNPTTMIEFIIPEKINDNFNNYKKYQTNLKIYDLLGNELETLISEELIAGKYNVEWNASAYPSGIYFCRLEILMKEKLQFSGIRKLVLIK